MFNAHDRILCPDQFHERLALQSKDVVFAKRVSYICLTTRENFRQCAGNRDIVSCYFALLALTRNGQFHRDACCGTRKP